MNSRMVTLYIKPINRVQIVKWVEQFRDRYEITGGNIETLIIKDVTYDEFIILANEYELNIEQMGHKFHIIPNYPDKGNVYLSVKTY